MLKKKIKPLDFTTTNRRRLLTLEALEVETEIILKYGKSIEAEKKTIDCCKRVKKRMENIREILWKHKAPEDIHLKPKDYYKYDRMRKRMYKFLIEVNSSTGERHIDHQELANASMVLVAKELDQVKDALSKNPESNKLKWLRHEWQMLLNSMVTLYTHMDPDFSDEGRIRLGEALAGKILLIADGKPFLHKHLAA